MDSVLRRYTEMAFFLLTKAPASERTEVDADVVEARLRLLQRTPRTDSVLCEQTAREEIAGFYQCMATFAATPQAYRWWLNKEQVYLAFKLQCYWAHIRRICRAENVEFHWERDWHASKFPWQERCLSITSMQEMAGNAYTFPDTLMQSRIANYHVDDATKERVLQMLRLIGVAC